MAINQLAKINFASLPAYIWRAQDFDLFQTYLKNYLKELIASRKTAGIIYGGQITVGPGLQVNVAKTLVLFATGELVAFDNANITLSAANSTNPRLDRIELGYVLQNNTQVTVADPLLGAVTQTLDQLQTAQLYVNQGTAAGSPSAPALTSGRLSLGIIHVAANQTILTSNDIDQSNASVSYASTYEYDSNHLIRINQATTAFELTTDGSNFYPITIESLSPGKFTIANNTGPADVSGLLLDSTKFKSARIFVDVYRSAGGTELSASGALYATWYPTAAIWKISGNLSGDDDVGVDFSMSGSISGQVQYTSSNLSGGSYTGTLRFKVQGLAQ